MTRAWEELPAEQRNRVLGYWRVHAKDMKDAAEHAFQYRDWSDFSLLTEDVEAYRAAIRLLSQPPRARAKRK